LALAEAPHRRRAVMIVEREFLDLARREGVHAAYRRYAADDVRLLRPNYLPASGLEASLEMQPEGELQGSPDFADAAWEADLGYAYGTARFRPAGEPEDAFHRYSFLGFRRNMEDRSGRGDPRRFTGEGLAMR
jgi:hypothetical protein